MLVSQVGGVPSLLHAAAAACCAAAAERATPLHAGELGAALAEAWARQQRDAKAAELAGLEQQLSDLPRLRELEASHLEVLHESRYGLDLQSKP